MKKLAFKKIDAFATENSDGNPAGYIALKSKVEITDEEMQPIAKALKGFVNEVGYLFKSAPNEFDLKYYSAEREVDFRGHATIAIMYDLVKTDSGLQQFFAPTFGYLEDPAIGSGNAAFGYYLIKNNKWKDGILTIAQNASANRFNIVKLQKQQDEKGNERVLFGGGAITRIEGEYIIQ